MAEPLSAKVGVFLIQAGLLTPGSLRTFPSLMQQRTVAYAAFVPGHSGGPVPDSHRVPHQTCKFLISEWRQIAPECYVRWRCSV